MLTATYSIITISTEQKHADRILSSLDQDIESNSASDLQTADMSSIKTILNKIMQFDIYCRARKIEAYVIPAIQKISKDLNTFFAELESLSVSAFNLISGIVKQLQSTTGKELIKKDFIYTCMQTYCKSLSIRLRKEKEQFFPVMPELLSNDEWFDIATKCLARKIDSPHQTIAQKQSPSLLISNTGILSEDYA
jgi:hypothetical protein